MHFVWGGPWSHKSSAAAFGASIVAELGGRGHTLEVLRTEVGSSATLRALRARVPVRAWTDETLSDASRKADAVIVNLGDSYPLYGAMLANLPRAGAVGIFHDDNFCQLSREWAMTSPDPAAMLQRLQSPASISHRTQSGTMIEFFASAVTGAALRTTRSARFARAVCPGPVAVIPLPIRTAAPRPRPVRDCIVANCVLALDAGLLERLSEAVESSLVRKRCRLLRAPSALPASSDVDVTILLDEDAHEDAVLACIATGRPTIVSSEAARAVPPGLVLTYGRGLETVDVPRHLEWVLRNPAEARALGARAQEYVSNSRSVGRYVDSLLALVDSAVGCRPMTLAGQPIGNMLSAFALDPSDPAVERIGDAMSGLFGNGS